MVSNLQVAALHVSPTVLVIGAGPVGEGVVAEPGHQGDLVVVVVGPVIIVSVGQGTVARLVVTTMIMVVVGLVMMVVVIVLGGMIMRNILKCWLRLRQLEGKSQGEGGRRGKRDRRAPYGGAGTDKGGHFLIQNENNSLDWARQSSRVVEAAVQVEISSAANVGRGETVLTLVGRTLQSEEELSQGSQQS